MVLTRKSTEVRKQEIMDAARKLIIKKGSEHLTVRRIAKEVNITEAAIYRHFKSKREILSFLVKNMGDSMLNEVNRTKAVDDYSLETLHTMLRNHLSKIEQRRGMSFQVIAEIISLGDKGLNREVFQIIEEYVDRLKALLEEGARKGVIRTDIEMRNCALLLFGMIQGLVNIWALSNYTFDLDETYSSLWAILCEAIVKK